MTEDMTETAEPKDEKAVIPLNARLNRYDITVDWKLYKGLYDKILIPI